MVKKERKKVRKDLRRSTFFVFSYFGNLFCGRSALRLCKATDATVYCASVEERIAKTNWKLWGKKDLPAFSISLLKKKKHCNTLLLFIMLLPLQLDSSVAGT